MIPLIGATKLKELTADDVDDWLDGLTGKLSTRSLQGVHSILKRAIRQAQARDKVLRNVAELVTTPKGRPGRPSQAMTLDQATAMLEQAEASPLHAYVVVSLLTGIRTEEARALRWDHVVAWVRRRARWQPVTEAGFDHERFAIYVWRSVRADGDTKTEKSRRTLELPGQAADALREHRARARPTSGSRPGPRGKITASCSAPAPAPARRGQRPPIVQRHHQAGRARGELDSPGAAPLVRVDHE